MAEPTPSNTEHTLEKAAAFHVEDVLGHGAVFEAKQASDEERAQTLWQALRSNRKAVGWSVLISMSIIMEGYDLILMNNFFAYPAFQRKFGHYYGGDIGWEVSGPWQTGLIMASTVGTIFGGILNGYFASKFGYRYVMIVALVFMTAFIFIVFFADTAAVLLVGQILCGVAWGVFAVVGPSYASEVCPTALRGYLTIYVNMCWAIGQLIAAGVMYALIDRPDEWSYRIPFAIQWVWPVPLMVICWFAPESPWFLVKRDRLEEAKRSLRRLSGGMTEDQINGQLAMLVHTTKIEMSIEEGTTYKECFTGIDLRRTEVCCLTFMGQILSGSTFAYAPTYFFVSAGMSTEHSYQLNVGGTAIAFVGTIISWWLITYLGRRFLYVCGQATLCIILLIIGILSAASNSPGSLWAQAGFCICWLFVYSLTVGPITYAIISETSSMRLRPLTVCLARIAYQLTNIVSQVLQTHFMNPTEWDAQGKTGFFWAGTALITFVWAFFRLPEAKGRTYEEMDILFARRIPARKFSKTKVDAYAQGQSQSGEALVEDKN